MRPDSDAVVTCPRCGEKFVQVGIEHWLSEGRTAGDFVAMVETLAMAHLDTCNPRRARRASLSIADRRRRWGWWALQCSAPAILTMVGVSYLLRDNPAGIAVLSGAFSTLVASAGSIFTYRSGYWRGRATSNGGPALGLHPADKSWTDPFERGRNA